VRRVLTELMTALKAGRTLTAGEVSGITALLLSETESAASKADLLAAWAAKGETADEIAVLARALRERAVAPTVDPDLRARGILDIVGTGGDRLGTFNVSSCAAIVAAAAGVLVAKHGNRAVTSKAGSADVLDALGIPIELDPIVAMRLLRERGFAFFYAPRYHPAFRQIAPARRLCAERGQRTVFNFLGPLLNPVRPTAQLMGVPRPEWCEPLARVLRAMDIQRGLVVCGSAGGREPLYMDEISSIGDTRMAVFDPAHDVHEVTLSPAAFPLQPATLADLQGGDRMANADTARRVLRGDDRGPRRDLVLMNAGAALWVAARSPSLTEGWELAAATIDSGKAGQKLEELIGAGQDDAGG